MSAFKKKINYYTSEEGIEVIEALKSIAASNLYNTGVSYSSNTQEYPDNKMPFVDKHMRYLNAHPNLDPMQYISNLRLMTRIR